MNYIFWISLIIILFSIPFIIFVIFLYLLKLVSNITFKIKGLYSISKLQVTIKTENISFQISLENIKLILRYPRLRLLISGIKAVVVLNKSEFKEINKGPNSNKENKFDYTFVKEKFSNILREKLYVNNKSGNKILSTDEIDNVDDVLKKQKSSYLNKIILFFLRQIDFDLEKIDFDLKILSQKFYYSLYIKRIILGVVKSTSKKSEIDLIVGIYDLNVFENSNKNQSKKEKWEDVTIIENNSNNNFNKNNQYNKWQLINLNSLACKIAFLDGFFLGKKSLSINNRISILIEGRDLSIKISNKSLNNIITLIVNIIIFVINNDNNNDQKFSAFNSDNITTKDNKKVVCIEQIIMKKLDGQFKKIEGKIQNVKIDLFSNNFKYKYMTILSNSIKLDRNSILYSGGGNINNELHLGKIEMELHLMEVKIYQIKNRGLYPVTELSEFSLSFKDSIIYHVKKQKAEVYSTIGGRLSDVDVVITTSNVSKILQLVFTIIDGIDLVEYVIKYGKQSLYKLDQELKDTTKIELDFSNINAYLYNSYFNAQFKKISFKVNMEHIKNITKQINVNFDVVSFSFSTKTENESLSNINTAHLLVNGFKIYIDDNRVEKKQKYINLYFTDSFLILNDRQLLTIIKVVSEIVGFILKEKIEKKLNRNTEDNEIHIKKRKTTIKLTWNKIEAAFIVHEIDMFHWFLEDVVFIEEEELTIPKFIFYHSTILQKNHIFHKFLDITGFTIKFRNDYDEMELYIDEFRINYYESNAARPIAHFILFFLFFPNWIDYYFTYQFMIDKENQREILKTLRNKTNWKNIRMNLFQFDINDNPVAAASIFQADKSTLLSKYEAGGSITVQYLKNIKKDLLTLKFIELNLEINSELTVVENNNPNVNHGFYCNSAISKSKLRLDIKETQLDLAGEKDHIWVMKNLIYENKTTKELTNFNPYKVLTTVILYDRHSILMKKADCEFNVDNKTVILLDNRNILNENSNNYNAEFAFQDTKVFDKTLTFIIKAINAIDNIPIKECSTEIYMDKLYNKSSNKTHIRLRNVTGHINSVDPKSNEIYNTLELFIEGFDYLKEEEKRNNIIKKKQLELTVSYLIFGFSPSQKSGFPLLILPLCELNQDGMKSEIKINVPTDILHRPEYIKSGKIFTKKNKEELNKLVLETKSLTIFLNYKYLSTFYKIFKIFLGKTKMLRKNKKNAEKSSDKSFMRCATKKKTSSSGVYKTLSKYYSALPKNSCKNLRKSALDNQSKFEVSSSSRNQDKNIKLLLFDLKIIYLLEYKEEYEDIFSCHKYVKEHGYFGYIFRIYSFNLSYNKLKTKTHMRLGLNFLTVSFLDQDTLSDEFFFVKDSEFKTIDFKNYKDNKEFNEFFSLDSKYQYKIINNYSKKVLNLDNNAKAKPTMINILDNQEDYEDLKFDYRHTFLKISKIDFMRNTEIFFVQQKYSLVVLNGKITWNKFNKDIFFLIIFKDLFLIIDKMFLSKKNEKKTDGGEISHKSTQRNKNGADFQTSNNDTITSKNSEDENSELSLDSESNSIPNSNNSSDDPTMTFDFVFENLQFVVQNEIKGSALLLICKKPIQISLINKRFDKDKKDFDLKIICRELQVNAPKIHKEKGKSNIIYWIGDSKNNKYYLNEDEFDTIIESPEIQFKVGQKIAKDKLKKNEYIITSKTEIKIDKIKGYFNSRFFNAFLNVVNVLIFDRGFSFSESKKSNSNKKEDLKKYKKIDLEAKIRNLIPTNADNSKTIREIIFKLDEVSFDLSKDNEKLLQFIMKKFEGNQHIHEDKSSHTQIIIFKLLVNNIENDIEIPVLLPLVNPNPKGLEDKINMITLTKNDRYVSLESKSLWYVLEYLEFSLRPFAFSISKKQIVFILDFFFSNDKDSWDNNIEKEKEITEEEEKEIKVDNLVKEEDNLSKNNSKIENSIEESGESSKAISSKLQSKNEKVADVSEKEGESSKIKEIEKSSMEKKIVVNKENEKKKKEDEDKGDERFPMYFKQFKINDVICLLKFEYAEAHPFNIPRTKLKFQHFEKHEKFYPLSSMINRLVGHCKKELIKNLGNIISGLFGGNDNTYVTRNKQQDKIEKKEAMKRKLLFGDK